MAESAGEGVKIVEMIKSPRIAMRENATLIKFLLVGASGYAVQVITGTFLKVLLGVLLGNLVAIELSIINNFAWNDRFTFQRNSPLDHASQVGLQKHGFSGKLARLLKYNVVSVGSSALNEAIVYTLYYFRVSYALSVLIAVIAGFSLNYFGSSRWAWRRSSVVKSEKTPEVTAND